MTAAAVLGDLWHDCRASINFDYRPQSVHIDWRGCVSQYMKGNLEMPSGTPPLLFSVHLKQSMQKMRKMCLKYGQCMLQLSSLHLCCLLLPSEIHPLCLSTRCLWWRQPVDDPGQQTAEAYRPPRAKGDFLSFNLSVLSSPFSFLFSYCYFYLRLSPRTILAIWSLHCSLRLTRNHCRWTQHTTNKWIQLNNTLLQTNTYTYVQYTGNISCTQTPTAAICKC